jgi:hypothetical protein
MMKLSEENIDTILDLTEMAYDKVKNFSITVRKKYLIEELRCYLMGEQSGLRENICKKCLGTGYEP